MGGGLPVSKEVAWVKKDVSSACRLLYILKIKLEYMALCDEHKGSQVKYPPPANIVI